MSEIPSIFDGWEKQCYDETCNSDGASCAVEYARKVIPLRAERHQHFRRIRDYLLQHYDIPVIYEHPYEGVFHPHKKVSHAVVYANNVLKLTPEDFRRIDRLTAMEEIARKLVESVPVQEGECVP